MVGTSPAGLGDKFMDSVEESLQLISRHPEYFSKQKGNFRSTKVKGFPYTIVYEFFKHRQIIHIASIYHGKRNPAKKFRRIKK